MTRASIVALLVTVMSAGPAAAAGSGAGDVGDGKVSVGLEVLAPGDGGAFDGDDPAAPSPIRVVMTRSSSASDPFFDLCNAPGVPGGLQFTMTVIDNATGEVLSTTPVCVPLVDVSLPDGPPVPQPPTITEIWRAIGIPAPGLGVSPAREGVVGLGTWLWSGGPTAVQVAVSLGGYTVTGTARLVEYRFAPGDGAITRSPVAGSSRHPAATHVYDRKGAYQVRVASAWEGDVTMTGPGLDAPLPIAIGAAVVTSAQAYPVVEVRSVLVP